MQPSIKQFREPKQPRSESRFIPFTPSDITRIRADLGRGMWPSLFASVWGMSDASAADWIRKHQQ